jgi:hypothetical protein
MAPLTAAFYPGTVPWGTDRHLTAFPVTLKASAVGFPGGMIAIDSNGEADHATAAAGLICPGLARTNFDESAGDTQVEVVTGCYKMDNSSGDAVVAGDLFGSCYIEDDHTVCHTSTSKSRAGTPVMLDDDGATVWVVFRVP